MLPSKRSRNKRLKKIVFFGVIFIILLIGIVALLKNYQSIFITTDSTEKISYELNIEDFSADNIDIDDSGEPKEQEKIQEKAEEDDEKIHINDQFSYIVTSGNTLASIFEEHGLDTEIAKKLIQKYPDLVNLKAGQQFYWITNNVGNLENMYWQVSDREEQIFRLVSPEIFERQVIIKKGIWKEKILTGQVVANLSSSLQELGISSHQVYQLINGLKPQLSLKILQKGDEIEVLANCEYVENKLITVGKVEALRLTRGHNKYYAILSENGHYYGEKGAITKKSQFSRYPLLYRPRISSHFNLRRRHPITRRVRPHKGVDFGLRSGTPIIAPADGVVTRVAYQRNGAGKYIKIKHGSRYETVYMHLSRQLVRTGQRVRKGQRIAYSGNTGRSTGPHLHYEFHINGQAVNPMRVRLPGVGGTSAMSNKERKAFLAKVKRIKSKFK